MSKCHGKESRSSAVVLGHLDEQASQQELCVIATATASFTPAHSCLRSASQLSLEDSWKDAVSPAVSLEG